MSRHRKVEPPFEQARRSGERVCVWCGGELKTKKGKQRWCSYRCVTIYQIARCDQNAARRWLEWDFSTENWTPRTTLPCAICGLDMHPDAVTARLKLITPHQQAERSLKILDRWDADHIVPLCEGGAATPENLRVLCRPCHLAETRALRARQAAARAKAKESA